MVKSSDSLTLQLKEAGKKRREKKRGKSPEKIAKSRNDRSRARSPSPEKVN